VTSREGRFDWAGATVLVTGGTGTFGQAFTRHLLGSTRVGALRIFSRDELKQWEMRRRLDDERLRFLIGDVRERDRLLRAFDGVDVVIHAAALKQVPAAEYNPFEAVKTNIVGAENVVDAAIERGVGRVLALSTDKAANPVNLYGATKLCAEKLFVQGNAYVGTHRTRLACVRYGNVAASRGSVVPLFLEQRASGRVTLTDRRMTRFWITVRQAVELVQRSIERMHGGELFVPKLPSIRIVDLIAAAAPGCAVDEVGIRPGEKLHETLVTSDEARRAVEEADGFIVLPEHQPELSGPYASRQRREEMRPYTSDTNDRWLDAAGLSAALAAAINEARLYDVAPTV
jgi:UDP-N-acetylglucosamine 4,6-dehydratase